MLDSTAWKGDIGFGGRDCRRPCPTLQLPNLYPLLLSGSAVLDEGFWKALNVIITKPIKLPAALVVVEKA